MSLYKDGMVNILINLFGNILFAIIFVILLWSISNIFGELTKMGFTALFMISFLFSPFAVGFVHGLGEKYYD